ncbi:hypothetical protein CDCA_CDCA02G0652 [Cyanidium caldarium]|uniref:Bax inhibitor 1 n=1 Tax=Cyanidium caldarium TaxID=2771 RepID=A0AAV9IQI1_CYACA|nr:hypothetical protein CDCA_CDCA02G0652 [Cyanidium caldarium]
MDIFGSDRFFNAETFKNFRQLTPPVREHVARVYRTVFNAALCAVLACALQNRWPQLLPLSPGMSMLAGGLTLWGLSPQRSSLSTRYRLLMLLAALEGYGVGPLIQYAAGVDQALVLQALIATALVFGSFSIAALSGQRRSYLYLGGYLLSALSVLTMLSLWALVWGMAEWNWTLQLYGGLLLFAGFVVFDTQMIIERAFAGDRDHVQHSLELWVDLFAIFVRVVMTLLRSQERRERDRRQREK